MSGSPGAGPWRHGGGGELEEDPGVGRGAWGMGRAPGDPPAPPHSRSRMQLHGGAVQRFFGGSRHPQVSSLMKSTVLMRQPRRVQEIVDALRRGGAGSLQVPRWDRVGMVPRGLSEARSTPPTQARSSPRPATLPGSWREPQQARFAAFPLVLVDSQYSMSSPPSFPTPQGAADMEMGV